MSKYRTIELSDPRFEQEGLHFVTLKSPALQSRGDFSIFLPPGHAELTSLPAVILLHGVYGSQWVWPFKAGVHRTAGSMIEKGELPPLALIMPSDGLWGDGSGYLQHQIGNFEKWIVKDVVGCAEECFSCLDASSPLFIAGLSMGGYGALRLGAKYPDQFRGISGHSSITAFGQMKLFVEEPLEQYHQTDQEEADVLYWMVTNRDKLPPLRFDCGKEDRLIEYNRKFHNDLAANTIEHIYEEFEGAHTWDYWETHIVDSLRFFGGLLA